MLIILPAHLMETGRCTCKDIALQRDVDGLTWGIGLRSHLGWSRFYLFLEGISHPVSAACQILLRLPQRISSSLSSCCPVQAMCGLLGPSAWDSRR